MGIQGLLPLLKSIHKPCNLKQFAGQTIGVDAYGWLHRGVIACAVELASGQPTRKYVDFSMHRVRMLKHFGITPYLVFDGDNLPGKAKTEKERSTRRKESKKLGLELLNLGKTSQAHQELQKAVDVTPEMAGLLIEELKRANVPYVVAPYEADSQMVYLEKQGIIDAILSEDSDLLVFGAKTLLTKLDQYGECVMIRRADFTACREVSLVGWSDREFRQMAIMSGCDYLNSIDKMGLKTAHRLLRQHKTMDRVMRALQFDGKFKVPPGYMEAFNEAELTFLHQWVFCPEQKCLVHFTPLEDGTTEQELPFIGEGVEDNLAAGVARGELHPRSKQPLQLPAVPTNRWMVPPQKKVPVVQTPELKKHKSIDSFFKPKRTPLAELNVNLFTGSPSQQEMARRASGTSWLATPVESSNTPTTTTARPSIVPSSAPGAVRRAVSGNDVATERTGSDRAFKRQRLCADGSSPVSKKNADKVQYGASKFFGGAPSISATPLKRSKKSAKAATDFTLWSDDSIEEALSQVPMPEVISRQKTTKKIIEVFQDEAPSQDVKVETQVTTVSAVFSQSQQPECTPPSSPETASGDEKSASLFDASLKAEMTSLRSKFAFGAAGDLKAAPLSKSKERESANHHVSRFQVDGAAERIDLNIEQAIPKEPRAQGEKNEDQLPHENGDQYQEIEDQDIVVAGSDAIEPASPIKALPETGQAAGGSEDLLVSESEAEVSEPGTPRPNVFMNLSRFALGAT